MPEGSTLLASAGTDQTIITREPRASDWFAAASSQYATNSQPAVRPDRAGDMS